MKNLSIKIIRYVITFIIVVLAAIAIFRAWVFYTESPWTRDAKFTADVVAMAPDVAGLVTSVPVEDNQLVSKGQVLFTIDQPRYQVALAQANADVSYYQALADEKKREATRRVKLGTQAMSIEAIEQSTNDLQTTLQQLAKAKATAAGAALDLERTTVVAPADGWVTNLTVHPGDFVTRGQTTIALVKEHTFYVLAYMEETKLARVKLGDHVEITPLGSNKVLHGTVNSVAAAVTDSSSTDSSDGLASIDSNLEWVRLAQRVPVKITLNDMDETHPYPAGTTATVVVAGEHDRAENGSWFTKFLHRLREFG